MEIYIPKKRIELKSFPYVADNNTRGIIIGSMPGEASLAAQEYYAHPRNLFWKFVYKTFNEPYNNPSYEEKIAFLKQHNLGLWDAAATCYREGSLDANIEEVAPNDFNSLFIKYPKITRLLFNGKKSYELFHRFNSYRMLGKEVYCLPSTSPANASKPVQEKWEMWQEALLLASSEDTEEEYY